MIAKIIETWIANGEIHQVVKDDHLSYSGAIKRLNRQAKAENWEFIRVPGHLFGGYYQDNHDGHTYEVR